MEKYMLAIERLESMFERMIADQILAFRIYQKADDRLAGLIEVAVADMSISNEEFSIIQDRCSLLVDHYYAMFKEAYYADM